VTNPQIVYEHPLNERIRTFLRFDFLCKQARAALPSPSDWANRICIQYLLEILDILSRTNLKKDIIQALERHLNSFSKFDEEPGVDVRQLNKVLDELDELIELLHSEGVPIGHTLRSVGLFESMRRRAMIAGGSSELDLPELHYWLNQGTEKRIATLQRWLRDLSTAERAVDLILRLTRDSAQTTRESAQEGFFHRSLNSKLAIQMIRIGIDRDIPIYPEISGGTHRIAIRMVRPSGDNGRPQQVAQNISFNLSCCLV